MKNTGARGAYRLLTGSEPEINKEDKNDGLGWFILFAIFIWLAIVLQGCCFASDIPEDQAIKAIIGEAESQGYDGMLAVASAIRNRGTLKGVYGLKAPRVVKGLYTKGTYLQARKAWRESATGRDTTLGSNSWENIRAFGSPKWSFSCDERITIKDHVFFYCKN